MPPPYTLGYRIISADALATLLVSGRVRVCVLDMRFPYEYAGGHIAAATNLCMAPSVLAGYLCAQFFSTWALARRAGTVVVFHCEYSQQRGPRGARLFMRLDSELNHRLGTPWRRFYREVFVLAGGYRRFFATHAELCVPHGYVRMRADVVAMRAWLAVVVPRKTRSRCRKGAGRRVDKDTPPLAPLALTFDQPSDDER